MQAHLVEAPGDPIRSSPVRPRLAKTLHDPLSTSFPVSASTSSKQQSYETEPSSLSCRRTYQMPGLLFFF